MYKYGRKLQRTAYGRDRPTLAKVAVKTASIIDGDKKYRTSLRTNTAITPVQVYGKRRKTTSGGFAQYESIMKK
jgi:hypothetical protein